LDRIAEIEALLAEIEDLKGSGLTDAALDAAIAALLAGEDLDDLLDELADLNALLSDINDSVADLQNSIADLTDELSDLDDLIADLTDRVADAVLAEADARAEADAARQAADDAQALAEALRLQADTLQAAADAALALALVQQPTVVTPGNLNLFAGRGIGSQSNPLSVSVGGKLNASAPNRIFVGGFGNLKLGRIQTSGTGMLGFTVVGDLTSDGSVISGASADLNSLAGDVGKPGSPIIVDVSKLTGLAARGFYVKNLRSVVIGSIIAGDKVDLTVDGSVTAETGTTPNIIADDLTLVASGDVGTASDPLRLAVGRLTMRGRNIYLKLKTDTTINQVVGRDVVIDSDANIWADDTLPLSDYHVIADNLQIDALGMIGTEQTPLRVWVSGRVVAASKWLDVHVVNYYKAPPEDRDDSSSRGRRPYRPGVRSDVEEEATEVAVVVISRPKIPLGNGGKEDPVVVVVIDDTSGWSLINLILTILGLLLALWLLLLLLRSRQNKRLEQPRRTLLFVCRLLALLLGLAALRLFITTEDLSGNMGFVNSWTIVHVMLFAGQIVFAFGVSSKPSQSSTRTRTMVSRG